MNDLHGYYLEDLKIGMSASYAKTVTEADVILMAGISGDNNPIHINEEFAKQTRFDGRIVHGVFMSALTSCVLGTRLPGPGAIVISQNMKFKAPVRINDTVTASARISEINEQRRRITLETRCQVNSTVVATGSATLMVNSRNP